MTGATTDTLSYPATSNRISTVLTGVTTSRTFTHDGAGNIATDTRSGSTFTYGYNARGRLATVSQDGNLKGTYQYNSLEQLASRVVTNSGAFNGTVHTTQDRVGNVIAEADGTTGVVAKEYIWLPGAGYAGTDLPVGVVDVAGTATPELLYVHADHLGRPIRLTDPAKVTAWAVEWLPWGGVHTISGSETLNARFPGQWFQVESGLHYNWHRHYDPSLGRYTQPDPLGFVDGPSVYAYAGNAPGELVDFSGLSPEVPGGPVVIDPRTGERVYPPNPKGPTTGQTIQPETPKPIPELPTLERACNRALLLCLAKCTSSPLCGHPAVRAACTAACATAYSACRFFGQFKKGGS